MAVHINVLFVEGDVVHGVAPSAGPADPVTGRPRGEDEPTVLVVEDVSS